MLDDADIMVTSFRDKALSKLGLDWESIHRDHPHLVWGQMRGYGEYGPDKNTKGFDATAYAARGGWFACLPQAGRGEQLINGGGNEIECFRCHGCLLLGARKESNGRRGQGYGNPAPLRPLAYADDAGLHPIW